MKLLQLGPNKAKVILGNKRFYFSYCTLVAYDDPEQEIRLAGPFSYTTTRHLSQMGVKNYKIVTLAEFEKISTEVFGF